MSAFANKTYWIVGASDGLGAALAKALDDQGGRCILSARRRDRLDAIAARLSRPAQVVECDVTDVASVAAAWDAVSAMGLDGVIYAAGTYDPMDAPTWDRDTVERMGDVNFMGGLRVLGRVTPFFAGRDSGHIVVIGSLSGYRGLPGAIGYGASNCAIMHLAESIRCDLAKTRVKISLINPGFIRTRLTDKNTFAMPFIMSPEMAAQRCLNAMGSRRFKTDFPWLFSLLFRASRFFPDWMYDRVFVR